MVNLLHGTTLEQRWRGEAKEMEDYIARCAKSTNRKSYTIIFRHPVVKEEGKNSGLKVHRGLGTTDEAIALELVEEMNTILKDDTWWHLQRRLEAYSKFSEKIVDAFYDPMNRTEHCNDTYLKKIRMPGKEEGYSHNGLLGMSGNGKTSVLRNICGTTKEHFPTTASGRTTTCNIEIITSDSDTFEAVITFVPRGRLEILVQECIEEAIKYILSLDDFNKTDKNILMEKLLEHENLTTRLNYILGNYSILPDDDMNPDLDYLDFVDDDELDEEEFEEGQGPDYIKQIIDRLDYYCSELAAMSEPYKGKLPEIEDGVIELVDDDRIRDFKDEILDDIQQRFYLLENGEKLNPRGKWFDAWYYQSKDREEFIRTLKRFNSNAKAEWGTLLTPIVESIRIKGAFKPTFCEHVPKLVLYDGEGLGHKTQISSVPIKTVDMLDRWDSIILVDNAASPIMDTTKILLKTIIDVGQTKKLMMAFTHFDYMEGDNMIKTKDKMKHVIAAVSSYLSGIKKIDANALLDTDRESILNSCYFFSNLNKEEISELSSNQFKRMFEQIDARFNESLDINDIFISYDAMTLFHHMQVAIRNYRKTWSELIGYQTNTPRTAHWSKIKALTRRLAYLNQDNYNGELQPLADLVQEISSQLSIYLNNPLTVTPERINDELKDAKINKIKGDINRLIRPFVVEILWKDDEQLKRWQEAYLFKGRYSTYSRTMKINEIYDWGIPMIDNYSYNMNNVQKKLITEFMEIVEKGLDENGGRISKFNYS